MGTAASKNSYDVIIIGSGPAGSTAAYFLAKSGAKTLVVEKEKLPRYKTCGGGVVGRVRDLLPFDLSEVIEVSCRSAEVYDWDSRSHYISERPESFVMMAMRQNFDSLILSKAVENGAILNDQCEVSDFTVNEAGIEVQAGGEKLFTKFIIAADGGLSIVSKTLKANNDIIRLPALEYEIYTNTDTYNRFCNKARFDFGIPRNGYGWVFPKKDHLSIGVISMTRSAVNLNETYFQYLKLLEINDIIKSERHGYIIPIAKRNKLFSHKRILFTGDSAGFADPLTAEGISSAVLSGKCAAESIINSGYSEREAASLYKKTVSVLILKEHDYARLISVLVYPFPKIRSFLFHFYGQKLTEAVTDIFSGKKQYSTLFKSPGFYLKLIKYFLINKVNGRKNKTALPVKADNLL